MYRSRITPGHNTNTNKYLTTSYTSVGTHTMYNGHPWPWPGAVIKHTDKTITAACKVV